MFYEGFEFGRRLSFELTGYGFHTVYNLMDLWGSRCVSQDFMRGFKAVIDMSNHVESDETRMAIDRGLRVI